MNEPVLERQKQEQHAIRAAEIYRSALTPELRGRDWQAAIKTARAQISKSLRATDYLRNVSGALVVSSAHMLTLRALFAPPVSQDQLALLCKEYPKSFERSGRPMQETGARAVAIAFEAWRDRRLTSWLDRGSDPSRREIESVLRSAGTILALQVVATGRRGQMAADQEAAVVQLLIDRQWVQAPSREVTTLEAVAARQFMHKVRFATRTQPQEVDIACGLGRTVVLAMECKVTNDQTNSVKRINDVLKKARAWQEHWGSFVRTAALLQGVIAFKDVVRLLDANVLVFWSHQLDEFDDWLEGNVHA
jgi:hypothetical protein